MYYIMSIVYCLRYSNDHFTSGIIMYALCRQSTAHVFPLKAHVLHKVNDFLQVEITCYFANIYLFSNYNRYNICTYYKNVFMFTRYLIHVVLYEIPQNVYSKYDIRNAKL